jgi:hypothetical protein
MSMKTKDSAKMSWAGRVWSACCTWPYPSLRDMAIPTLGACAIQERLLRAVFRRTIRECL